VTPTRTSRLLAALLAGGVLWLGASACGADEPAPAGSVDSSGSAGSSAAPLPADDALARIDDGARVVDVRTPEEFDAGHLDGAVNIDYQHDDFAQLVGELPKDVPYVVYCASGRRATGAVEQMRDLGFTDVVNGGGYADLVG
jgi:phage shock protein E